jgi:excinuclease ABC subunit B
VHGITPRTVFKEVADSLVAVLGGPAPSPGGKRGRREAEPAPRAEAVPALIDELRKEMKKAAAALEFERAAELRDRIKQLEVVALAAG